MTRQICVLCESTFDTELANGNVEICVFCQEDKENSND